MCYNRKKGGIGMRNVRNIELDESSREELLPDFIREFPYIASRAELDCYPQPEVPWHWHGPVELFYMESGCLEYETPHGKQIFPAGSGGFVNANVLHTSRWRRGDEQNVQLLHLFDPVLLCGEQGSRMEEKYMLPLTASGVELIPLFPEDPVQREILQEIRCAFDLGESEWGYEFRLREKLSAIWLQLLELAGADRRIAGERPEDGQIKLLMVYIHRNFEQDISVEQLAQQAHISKRACFRLFREQLHMTPMEYLLSYRLQQACRMLRNTRVSVTQIAQNCGLGSSSYFGKKFREHHGCTPMEYRRTWQDCDNSGRKNGR